ncbi:MAG: hypothetical protein KUG68_08940 [Flavobacteriaceae bacterium]|nr:hypothetical protein [Flavobacteriaceae bacterium]
MKSFKLLILALLMLPISNANAQEKDQVKDTEDKIKPLFTSKDKDFMQMWFYEQVLEMDLSEIQKEEYYSNLTYHVFKMSKLQLPKYGYTCLLYTSDAADEL